jgi:hypothetical protein
MNGFDTIWIFVSSLLGLFITILVIRHHNIINKKYFPEGINEEGLKKMKMSVSAEKYVKFLKKISGIFAAQSIAAQEQGEPANQKMEEALAFMKKDLKSYE